jgi:sugar/nucleoside kinase (ribokinase family)
MEPAAPLDAVVIGSALVDVLAEGTEEELARQGLTKGSMTLVDLAGSHQIYNRMGPATEISGGSAANTAAGLAALGGSAGFLGKVADDAFGELFRHDLTAAGVEVGPTRPVPLGTGRDGDDDLATGRCLVQVTPDGERTMATHLGVASTFSTEDVPPEFLARASVVYLEGYLWDVDAAKDAMRLAMELGHAGDALVALTVSDPFCVERHQREFLDLLQGDVDLLFANEEEARLLFGASSFESALDAVEETGLLAAVTRGPAGAVVVAPHGIEEVTAVAVDEVVDTTGAGDLFAAGFLFGLTHGHDPVQCARLGALCAAEVISHLGARPQRDLVDLARSAGLA